MVRPPYPVAVRLCVIASDRWPELDAAYYQINLLKQKPHRFANLVLAWVLSWADPEKVDEWLDSIAEPLPWQDMDSEAAIEHESASFMDMMNKGK